MPPSEPASSGRPVTSKWRIEWHDCLPSTMDRAGQLATSGEPAGAVIVAGYQSQGRGTRGRNWHAPPNSCLMFSIILRPAVAPDRLTSLPASIAELLAAALRKHFGLDPVVKAPNDILVNGKKICGILCTSRVQGAAVEWVICGIGLNSTMSRTDLPTPTATSLAIEGIDVPPHRELLATVLAGLQPLLKPELPGLTQGSGGCATQH